jgi:hypothetical protein
MFEPHKLAPQEGLEPPTRALTVRCSTSELLGNNFVITEHSNTFGLIIQWFLRS